MIGPGDLYTSIIPLFLVGGIREALQNTKAKLVYVVNLMTKAGQTNNYTANNHVRDIEKYLGRTIDTIIMHKGMLNESIVEWYESHHEHTVIDDMKDDKRVVYADIADNTPVAVNTADKIASYARSILRHDSTRIARTIMTLYMIRKHTISFKHAFDGLIVALSTQPNYRIHLFLSLLSIGGGVLFHIRYEEFLIIGVLITVGLVIETINTAIEETCDAIDEAIRPDIKIAKDTGAAAMLIFALGSSILAGIIFIPHIIQLFI